LLWTLLRSVPTSLLLWASVRLPTFPE
jgi:hypothetical protein